VSKSLRFPENTEGHLLVTGLAGRKKKKWVEDHTHPRPRGEEKPFRGQKKKKLARSIPGGVGDKPPFPEQSEAKRTRWPAENRGGHNRRKMW